MCRGAVPRGEMVRLRCRLHKTCKNGAWLTYRSSAWRGLDPPGSTAEPTAPGGRCPVGLAVQEEAEEWAGDWGRVGICVWNL